MLETYIIVKLPTRLPTVITPCQNVKNYFQALDPDCLCLFIIRVDTLGHNIGFIADTAFLKSIMVGC